MSNFQKLYTAIFALSVFSVPATAEVTHLVPGAPPAVLEQGEYSMKKNCLALGAGADPMSVVVIWETAHVEPTNNTVLVPVTRMYSLSSGELCIQAPANTKNYELRAEALHTDVVLLRDTNRSKLRLAKSRPQPESTSD